MSNERASRYDAMEHERCNDANGFGCREMNRRSFATERRSSSVPLPAAFE